MVPGGGGENDPIPDEFTHRAEGISPPSTAASSSSDITHHHFSPFPLLNSPREIPADGNEFDEDINTGSGGPPALGGRMVRSIAERRAARSGFKAERLDTGKFPAASSLQSPYLTIPSGLSPTTLLDSPVMLLNSLAQLSPTTGTFPNFSTIDQNPDPLLDYGATKETKYEGASATDMSLAINPHRDSDTPITYGVQNKVFSSLTEVEQHEEMTLNVLHQREMLIPIVDPSQQGKLEKNEWITDSVVGIETSVNSPDRLSFVDMQSAFSVGKENASNAAEQIPVEDLGSQVLLEVQAKELSPLSSVGKPSEDGYNWRKYGQKQVKGSEYTRSYYKCTHPSCQVKKKVERSQDGQITEIIYKGTHSHPKPQPCRSAIGSAFALNEMTERPEGTAAPVKIESGSILKTSQEQGLLKDESTANWKNDILEGISSVSAVTDISGPSAFRGKHLNRPESADSPPEISCRLASDDEFEDDEDGATQAGVSLGDDADESESKRRKIDYSTVETNFSSRAVREPRVVVQTTSEVDILDDGYRWRKYGQKVVKGNPNPRSYYKCTNPGCSVRKHVERASPDLKSVITTYEGKHNHEVPAARNGSNGNSVSVNMGSSSVSSQSSLVLATASCMAKPEPIRIDNFIPNFEVNGFLNPGTYLRSLAADTKLGISSGYNMKFPPLQSMAFNPFGTSFGQSETNPTHLSLSQTESNYIPRSTTPSNMQMPASLPIPLNIGFHPVNGVSVMQHNLQQQKIKEADPIFVRPKERAEG